MDEGGRYQDTGAEVPRYKEELVRNRYRGKALDDDGKGASCSTQREYQEQREDMYWRVIVSLAALASTFRSFLVLLLSSEQFRVEDMRRYF